MFHDDGELKKNQNYNNTLDVSDSGAVSDVNMNNIKANRNENVHTFQMFSTGFPILPFSLDAE